MCYFLTVNELSNMRHNSDRAVFNFFGMALFP